MIVIQPGDRVIFVADSDDVDALHAASQAFRQAFPDVEALIVARSWMIAEANGDRLDSLASDLGVSMGDALREVINAGLNAFEPKPVFRPSED